MFKKLLLLTTLISLFSALSTQSTFAACSGANVFGFCPTQGDVLCTTTSNICCDTAAECETISIPSTCGYTSLIFGCTTPCAGNSTYCCTDTSQCPNITPPPGQFYSGGGYEGSKCASPYAGVLQCFDGSACVGGYCYKPPAGCWGGNLAGKCDSGLTKCSFGFLCCESANSQALCDQAAKDPKFSSAIGTRVNPFNPLCGAKDSSGQYLGSEIWTALGCISVGKVTGLTALITWSLGIATGIAVLAIGYSGFLITTASGDAKRVQAGREMLISSLMGLFLIVGAVLLLNFIGVKILNLGGLGFSV